MRITGMKIFELIIAPMNEENDKIKLRKGSQPAETAAIGRFWKNYSTK